MLQDAVISEVHKICDVWHFLEIREMSLIFSNLANLYRIYNVLLVSSASAERSFSRLNQIKKLQTLNNGWESWDPIVGLVPLLPENHFLLLGVFALVVLLSGLARERRYVNLEIRCDTIVCEKYWKAIFWKFWFRQCSWHFC